MAVPQILVIEDDPLMQRVFERLLKAKGYAPTVVRDFTDVLGTLRQMQTRPALVLLDLMMPGISGLDILAFIKSDATWNLVPVVVVTNVEQEERGREALEKGAALYLVKSEHDPQEIVANIESIITGSLPAGN